MESRDKDLHDFDKGQIVMAWRMAQIISETARLVGCSQSAVVRIYQQSSKEGKNLWQGVGRPRIIDARGQGYPIWSKPEEGLCSAGKPRVQPFMRMYIWHIVADQVDDNGVPW